MKLTDKQIEEMQEIMQKCTIEDLQMAVCMCQLIHDEDGYNCLMSYLKAITI